MGFCAVIAMEHTTSKQRDHVRDDDNVVVAATTTTIATTVAAADDTDDDKLMHRETLWSRAYTDDWMSFVAWHDAFDPPSHHIKYVREKKHEEYFRLR